VSPRDEQRGPARPGGDAQALIVVRNPCTHDSRVLREAGTLRELGYRPLILAVTSDDERARRSVHGGIPIVRLSPTSPLAWARSRLRPSDRARREAGADPVATEGPGPVEPAADPPTPLRSLATRVHRWLRTIDYYRRAIGVVRRLRPAIIHCNDYNTMWVGVAARRMGGTAVVYDAHELWPDRNLRPEPRWWLLACEFLFVRAAHRNVTSSPGYAEVMARRYRVPPPKVVRNIPDRRPPSMAPTGGGGAAAAPAAEPADGDTVAYVGALTRNRGLEVSIRALALVPDARLRLVGPVRPSYRRELASLAAGEGVSDRVEFATAVPPAQVVDSIRGATAGLALIQPACLSYALSLPNKLFEYLAAGLPVLASDLPVIGGFVDGHGIGLVARAGDVEDVAAKLREVLAADRNRALRAAVAKAAAEIRWDRERGLLAETYAEAVAASRPERR
jgi:glycosyltransferase involved in cell wall biosynthesis